MSEVPAVAYPTGRSYRLGVGLAGLWLAGAVAVLAWCLHQAASQEISAWRIWVLMLALVLTGVTLFFFWRSQTPRRLVFDGDQWHLTGGDLPPRPVEPIHVAILWDAQRCMLLRWPSSGHRGLSALWLWVDASIDPYRWHLLRCALYSPANRPHAEIIDDSVTP